MQRLFSTFANGWPGFGLLIQRLVLGIALLNHGADLLGGVAKVGPIVPELAGPLLGLCILAGLWTPVVGALVAVMRAWIAMTVVGDHSVSIILAVLGGTLAMIGPGAWSIDARLFGRKHIVN